ncbi:MAG: hypothetical protein KGL39_38290, partial [Patescibacteria group bacterium]|nr:hypothetical protein [Patescibacteria group bacterium]
MKIAICLLTKDRIELTRQTAIPLLEGARNNLYHLFCVDGSEKYEKETWEILYPTAVIHSNIRGGAGAAIVYALTWMLNHPENYDAIGLVENDVLLGNGWTSCFDLFQCGQDFDLKIGAISARCFTDRVLFQRESYAICHNLGAGCIVLSREAAKIILDTFRTAWTVDNRRIFAKICGIDLASYWAFGAYEHNLTSDWGWDAALAARGLSSLALTPSPCEMIGQVPPLAEQSLHIVGAEPLDFEISSVRDEEAFNLYCKNMQHIRNNEYDVGVETKFQFSPTDGTWTYFPHQMHMLGGKYTGGWKLRELRGWGTFGWEADETQWDHGGNISLGTLPQLVVPAFGTVAILLCGGKNGGKAEVWDAGSSFKASPELVPEGDNGQVLQLMVPGGLTSRKIHITAL